MVAVAGGAVGWGGGGGTIPIAVVWRIGWPPLVGVVVSRCAATVASGPGDQGALRDGGSSGARPLRYFSSSSRACGCNVRRRGQGGRGRGGC